jgi:Glycosyltransferase family 28 C-terminal domain
MLRRSYTAAVAATKLPCSACRAMSARSAKGRLVLVTVGTTKFDHLIQAVDSVEFIQTLRTARYTALLVQHGHGDYRICNIQAGNMDGVAVECALPAIS